MGVTSAGDRRARAWRSWRDYSVPLRNGRGTLNFPGRDGVEAWYLHRRGGGRSGRVTFLEEGSAVMGGMKREEGG